MNERRTGLIDVAGSRDTRSIGLLYPNSTDGHEEHDTTWRNRLSKPAFECLCALPKAMLHVGLLFCSGCIDEQGGEINMGTPRPARERFA